MTQQRVAYPYGKNPLFGAHCYACGRLQKGDGSVFKKGRISVGSETCAARAIKLSECCRVIAKKTEPSAKETPSLEPSLIPHDAAVEGVGVGAQVSVPGRAGTMLSATITEVYGLAVKLKFFDGSEGWLQARSVTPVVKTGPAPTDKGPFEVGAKLKCAWLRTSVMGEVKDVYGKLVMLSTSTNGLLWILAASCEAGVNEAQVGAAVKAIWTGDNKFYSGKIAELYGKIAFIKFDDGDTEWTDVTSLDPSFPQPKFEPTDSIRFKKGDKVTAIWGVKRLRIACTVQETYGKFMLVALGNGSSWWTPERDATSGWANAKPPSSLATGVKTGATKLKPGDFCKVGSKNCPPGYWCEPQPFGDEPICKPGKDPNSVLAKPPASSKKKQPGARCERDDECIRGARCNGFACETCERGNPMCDR